MNDTVMQGYTDTQVRLLEIHDTYFVVEFDDASKMQFRVFRNEASNITKQLLNTEIGSVAEGVLFGRKNSN